MQYISSGVAGIFGEDMFLIVISSVRPCAFQGASRIDDEGESSAVFRCNTVKCNLLFQVRVLRVSQAQQLTGKRKGKVQENEETPKVSGVERLPKRKILPGTDQAHI